MNKRLFIIIALAATFMAAKAQDWRVTITKTDGTTVELLTSEIASMTFDEAEEQRLPDSNADQLLIKEIYNGGCQKDDGSGNFHFDKCVIIYNNSPRQVVANNLCLGIAAPYNAEATNRNYDTATGRLNYESEGFTPVIHTLAYYPHTLVVEPFSQVVVNICGAIDNTKTVSASVNYADPSYYCFYDPEAGYTHTSYYPAPSELIPTSHYWRGIMLGQGTGWTFSNVSPAVLLFQTVDTTPQDFAHDAANYWFDGGNDGNNIYRCLKVPNDWIIDGVEVFNREKMDACTKRLTAAVDGGYVALTHAYGHSLYRNVDQELTEMRPENAGKLVYAYSLGVDSSTDPSGIDAEASIALGAHIYYLDSNNSSADFHERQRCSLRK